MGFRVASSTCGAAQNATAARGETSRRRWSPTAASDQTTTPRIDNFVLDKGAYQIWAIGNLSCSQARQRTSRAPWRSRTTLPQGWKHNIKSAIVTVGGGKGFRLKLAQ